MVSHSKSKQCSEEVINVGFGNFLFNSITLVCLLLRDSKMMDMARAMVRSIVTA